MPLLIVFVAIPIIEIALFIQVGGWIGLWPTLAIVIATAIIGTQLLRRQGRAAMEDLQRAFNQLTDPSRPLADGAMILFAGALLLTPGFFTDAVGLSLMVPGVRRRIYAALRARVKVAQFDSHTQFDTPTRPQSGQAANRNSTIIDGEFEEVPPRDPGAGPSGWTNH